MSIPRTNLMNSDEIYEDLCLKIEHLEYMPGQALSENELCTTYGVTRHVIRNSLARLKARKLVEVYPQRGTYVSLIDMKYISDVLYLRESVEQEAMYRVMMRDEKFRNEVADKMQRCLEKQQQLKRTKNYNEDFHLLDNEFHQTMLESVDRPNIMGMLSEPYIHIRRWRNFEIRTEERMLEIMEEHQGIIDAIREGNETVGHERLHIHLDTTSRYYDPLKEAESQYFKV